MKQPNAGNSFPSLALLNQLDELQKNLNVLFDLKERKEQAEKTGDSDIFVRLSTLYPSLPDEILKEIVSTTSNTYYTQIERLYHEYLEKTLSIIKNIAEAL